MKNKSAFKRIKAWKKLSNRRIIKISSYKIKKVLVDIMCYMSQYIIQIFHKKILSSIYPKCKYSKKEQINLKRRDLCIKEDKIT